MFVTGTANNGKFNEIDKTSLAYTEGDRSLIVWRGVFCANKPYFPMLGHN